MRVDGPCDAARAGRGPGSRTPAASMVLALALLGVVPRHAEAGAAAAFVGALEGRISVGRDYNLLDASDAERASFANHDPGSFFVVNSMGDQFLEGTLGGEWRLSKSVPGRPRLRFDYLRRQYLDNPIRSSDRYAFGVKLAAGPYTRADLAVDFQPQIYRRHRQDDYALPGEPVFRPEVYQRTDGSFGLSQALSPGTSIRVSLDGSIRDYRAPFDARDRRIVGGSGGFSQALAPGVRISVSGSFARTRSRNDPLVPTDLSNREWGAWSRLEMHSERTGSGIAIEGEMGWRHYTSIDPADHSYFGRTDRLSGVSVELTQTLKGALASTTRFAYRSSLANQPTAGADDDTFTDSEVQTGLLWSRSNVRRAGP
jgi:hypothetical protein